LSIHDWKTTWSGSAPAASSNASTREPAYQSHAPSVVAEPPSPRITRFTPASRALLSSSPVPRVLAARAETGVRSPVVSRASPLAERKQITVVREGVPDEVLRGDRELMEYAFYNLLTNAIKYSPAETRVRIFGSSENGRLRLSVEDQGIGMDQKEVRRIFEKFYRAHTGNIHNVKGFGLGLSYVKTVVEAHGGTIKADSVIGKGSIMTIELSLRKES